MPMLRKIVLTAAACLVLGACALNSPLPDETADDGFLPVADSLFDELHVAPGASLAKYPRVFIDPIEVSFQKYWRRQHEYLSDADVEALQARLARMLRDTLEKELARGGYALAESPAVGVLRVRPSLVDVDLVSPESRSDQHTYAYSAGTMTLRLLAFDGESGALIARVRDYSQDRETQFLERADRISTNQAALRMFAKWSEALRSLLDVAKVGVRTLPQ
jgi:hypothetical protein